MDRSVYQDPLITRYASDGMKSIFSDEYKFSTWRKCWIALAEAERELGVESISEEAIRQMRKYQDDVNFERAEKIERETRHDVNAHIKAYSEQCPEADGIIHLGATSMYVGDNTDLITIREALSLVKRGVVNVIHDLSDFSMKHKDLACLGLTHYQAAQPVTVGKRATLYIQDLMDDLLEIEGLEPRIKARGAKGTTGTQDSYLKLFRGDHEKVKELDRRVAEKMGFDDVFPVTGQTYPRKLDTRVLAALGGIATSASKFAVDVRLLSNRKEWEEPFGRKQVGSSAMAYKKNPMRCERMTGLGRELINMVLNPYHTHANQWLERTLDDSAARRRYIPGSFLLADSILILYKNVASGLNTYPAMILRHLTGELPFMGTEEVILGAVERGVKREDAHEAVRECSMEAAKRVKLEGKDNNLTELLAKDKRIPFTKDELDDMLVPERHIGRAPEQTEEYLTDIVQPKIEEYRDLLGDIGEVKV